jgi:hypothetical protein
MHRGQKRPTLVGPSEEIKTISQESELVGLPSRIATLMLPRLSLSRMFHLVRSADREIRQRGPYGLKRDTGFYIDAT